MSQHVRYADGLKNERAVVFFVREDLLWRGELAGLAVPLVADSARGEVLIGPTILDVLVRRELAPSDDDPGAPPAAVWSLRPAKDFIETVVAKRSAEHPFRAGLVSGGTVTESEPDDGSFIRVTKRSSVSLSAYAFRLAVATLGGLNAAHAAIAVKAANAWRADLERSLALYDAVSGAHGREIDETPEIAALRPAGSVSDAIETEILREACMLLGVDPDMDIRRPRGRPRRTSSEAEVGDFIQVELIDGLVHARTLAAINGIPAQTDLSTLTLLKLVALLDALNQGGAQTDAELLEAYLDAAAPEWRTSSAAGDAAPGTSTDDPYAILGVTVGMSMDEITQVYRRAMQAMHPDKGACPAWFAQVAAAAYRRIKDARMAAQGGKS